MPYQSIDELPDPVKKLPEEAQRMWLKVFNSAEKQYDDESRWFATAWSAVNKKYGKSEGFELVYDPLEEGKVMDVVKKVYKKGKEAKKKHDTKKKAAQSQADKDKASMKKHGVKWRQSDTGHTVGIDAEGNIKYGNKNLAKRKKGKVEKAVGKVARKGKKAAEKKTTAAKEKAKGFLARAKDKAKQVAKDIDKKLSEEGSLVELIDQSLLSESVIVETEKTPKN